MCSAQSDQNTDLQRICNTDFSDPAIFHPNPTMSLVDIHTIMETGMNVARFLPCKGTNEDKVEQITKIVEAAKYLSKKHGMVEWPCATCMELKTCVIRTGILEEGASSIQLPLHSEVSLTCDITQCDKCNAKQIFVNDPNLTLEVRKGMEISLRQQAIVLQVKEIATNKVICTVTKAGKLKNLDIVCMRGAKRLHPNLSKKDMDLVKLAVENKVDMIITQYTRRAETIRTLKKFIRSLGYKMFLVCGICTEEGILNIEEIIKEADGILVSREFLPYELELKMTYSLDRIQKYIVGKCRQAGKPVYVSGQVFESLLLTDTLFSRDITDIANCLLQGVSGFILKPWDNPDAIKKVIKELTDLCTQIEPFTNDKIDFRRRIDEDSVPINAAMAAVTSCVMIANETQAKMIVIPTVSGRTVYHLNALRTVCLILAVTTNIRTFRLLQINRSVIPILYNGSPSPTWQKTIKSRINFAIEYALNKNWVSYSDYYVTIQKGAELSPYCDTVCIFKVTTKKKTLVTCDEKFEDKY